MTIGSFTVFSSTPQRFDDPIATVRIGTREESAPASDSTRAARIFTTVSPLRNAWCMRRAMLLLGGRTPASLKRTIFDGGRTLGGYGLGGGFQFLSPPGGGRGGMIEISN